MRHERCGSAELSRDAGTARVNQPVGPCVDAEDFEQSVDVGWGGGLVEGDSNGCHVDPAQVDPATTGLCQGLVCAGDFDGERVEPCGVSDSHSTVGEALCECAGQPMDASGDPPEAVRAVVDTVEPGHDSEEHLSGADVRCCLLPADVLFAGLERQPKTDAAFGVLRDTDHAAGELALVSVTSCHEGGVRSSEHHRHAETLRAADHGIGADLPRWGQQGHREQVHSEHGERTGVVDAFDGRGVVSDDAQRCRVLNKRSEHSFGKFGVRVADRHLDANRQGSSLDHFDGLRVGLLVNEEHVARPSIDPLEHRHCLGRRGPLIEEGRIRDLHARQIRHHGLEVEQRFEAPLGDLRLIGRVCGVPPGALEHVALDDLRRDGVGVAHADQRGAKLVAVCERAQACHNLSLRHRAGHVVLVFDANRRRDGSVDEVIDRRRSDHLEHGHDIRIRRADVA